MRLIDADALKALIDDGWGEGPFKTAFFEEVDDTPTIDPVKHGRWLPEGKYACRCSNCGRAINNRLAASYKFCPECGAKTDKKEE